MKLTTLLLMVLISTLLVVSCGQKVEQASTTGDSFIHWNYASAKQAATESGKYMVLDFYTDW